MTFGEKLKKIRTDNNMTQEDLAEKIYVTRTAVSKWETDKGYPSIDSLKQLSNLFHISLDELVSNEDVDNKRLLDEQRSRKFYWCAIIFLTITIARAIVVYITKWFYFRIIASFGAVGYVVFALYSKPKYKRAVAKKKIVPYIISRFVLLAVLIMSVVCFFMVE